MPRALVIRPGALGDAVVTLPVLHALLAAGFEQVTVLGTPESWRFLNPAQTRARVLDAGSVAWLGLYGGSLAMEPKAVLAEIDAAIVCLAGEAGEGARATLRNSGIADVLAGYAPRRGDRGPHVARRLLAPLAERWGDTVFDSLTPRALADDSLIGVGSDEAGLALGKLGVTSTPGTGLLALHPGSGGAAKRWPIERFIALAERGAKVHGTTPVWITGPADADISRHPELASAHHASDWPLRHVLALMSCVRAYVGNDSGVTHLAARATPTIALFGPTDAAAWCPIGSKVAVVTAPGSAMDSLDVETVGKALDELLNRDSRRASRDPNRAARRARSQ